MVLPLVPLLIGVGAADPRRSLGWLAIAVMWGIHFLDKKN